LAYGIYFEYGSHIRVEEWLYLVRQTAWLALYAIFGSSQGPQAHRFFFVVRGQPMTACTWLQPPFWPRFFWLVFLPFYLCSYHPRPCLTTSFWVKMTVGRRAACGLPCLQWWGVGMDYFVSFYLIAFNWLFSYMSSRCLLSPQKLLTSTPFCIKKFGFEWMFCLRYI